MFSVVFALLTVLVGCMVVRVLRVPLGLAMAPVVGLACLPILTAWSGALGAPPWLRSALVLVAVVGGAVLAVRGVRKSTIERTPALLLFAAVAIPALLLGLTFGRLEVPTNHDGLFHVEAVDGLRNGTLPAQWYPTGFHSSVAAVLGLVPWLDTARGTSEAGLALAILAPLAVFALGLALGLRPLVAAIAAVVQAVTFIYPYDYQVWGGWPLGMGVLLLLGVWASAVCWTREPSVAWALVCGACLGAIVLTHGTELYSAALGLAIIGFLRTRHVDPRRLAAHAALGLGLAVVVALPYLPTLLGWAGSGGAFDAGATELSLTRQFPEFEPQLGVLDYAVGMTGSASALDLGVRVAVILLALRSPLARLPLALWAVFVTLVLLVDVVRHPSVDWLFATTFPWLTDRRPWQLAVIMTSLLSAIGIAGALAYLHTIAQQLRPRPNLARRLAVGCAILVAFLAEGSAVSIYKRLVQDLDTHYVYSADDRAAMAWLSQHLQPGEVLANDGAVDAGIWAPYKANVPILLPRLGAVDSSTVREPIVSHVLDLKARPTIEAAACALNVHYLYRGARDHPYHARLLPPHDVLEQDPNLLEVFRSGDVAVFKIDLPCA